MFEKKLFSMITPEVDEFLRENEDIAERKKAVIFGIESHVCVLQTVLDLIDRDYEVHLVTDGISSQRKIDRTTALHRLGQQAFLTTSESLVFQLVGSADHENFKAISALAKDKKPEDFFSSL